MIDGSLITYGTKKEIHSVGNYYLVKPINIGLETLRNFLSDWPLQNNLKVIKNNLIGLLYWAY